MKLNEKFIDGDGSSFHVQKTFDPNPTLDAVKKLRELGGNGPMAESKHVGRVPGWMLDMWLKEAGIASHDTEAVQDLLKSKLLSGDFAAFRNWEGTF